MRAYDGPMSRSPEPQTAGSDARPLSALPSPLARALAFLSILLAGAAGGLIGYVLVDIQYSGNSQVPLGVGLLVGSILSAGGTAIVAVLVLRALGEWHAIDRPS